MLMFFLVAMTNTGLQLMGTDQRYQRLVNIFIIRPMSATFGAVFSYLYSCPLARDVAFSEKRPLMARAIRTIARFVGILLILGGVMLLVLAALFTTGNDRLGIVAKYLIQVHVASVVIGFYGSAAFL